MCKEPDELFEEQVYTLKESDVCPQKGKPIIFLKIRQGKECFVARFMNHFAMLHW